MVVTVASLGAICGFGRSALMFLVNAMDIPQLPITLKLLMVSFR